MGTGCVPLAYIINILSPGRVVATVSQQETEGTALYVSLANVTDLVGETVITIIQQRFPFGKSKLTHRLFSTHRTGIIARSHRQVTL